MRSAAIKIFAAFSVSVAFTLSARAAQKPTNDDCLACHGDSTLGKEVNGKPVSLYVSPQKFAASIHGSMFSCVDCHSDIEGPMHVAPPAKVNCGSCHDDEAKQLASSLHGRAASRGDPLAPRCVNCHGNHDIVPVKDPRSRVAPLNIPLMCGQCHREGTPVQRNRGIGQHNILENFSESIHGEGLLRKGLIVAPSCASCHTAHSILPHTDPASSISRGNIAKTCTKCHAEIEMVHRRIIRGELWEKQAHTLPACVDCHQPHKIRNALYQQGVADLDCLSCHANQHLKTADGRSMSVSATEVASSRHAKIACSQCHSEVNPARARPCETITRRVDCTACHAEVGQQHQQSIHGQLLAKQDRNAPDCKECHGTHHVLGRTDPQSPTFSINVPELCGQCHHEGHKAALRYVGSEHQIVRRYEESIHGKGLLQSGLTVTATCTNCHTAHHELPASDPQSSVNRNNVPKTCGRCHHGIEEQFVQSVHSAAVTKTDKPLPICNDCHTSHDIARTDKDQFKLEIMTKCGHCHAEIAKTYFDTYHGKVSRLGYTDTAKCNDCHGAHDIFGVGDPRSHLSRVHVVETCRKCHHDATRRFAGYLTHATHHDPKKYPFLFWTFWGMTSLLIGTFAFSGIHTLLWLPRALQMRHEEKEDTTEVSGGEGEA